ncbi:MAG: hypothetical protein H6587_11115 [Flavobacteriales bacterium]|nr:hypothetical protein [Flavobacteriales bacterium]MCB9365109.1 hypothetical protein [Flavobacteriales bacterium]
MKKFFSCISISLLLFSCTSVVFTNPQPTWVKNSTHFPEEIYGTYYTNENDTFEIGANFYKVLASNYNSLFNNNIINEFYLSDSLLLKQLGKKYFLNAKENDNWTISLLNIKKNQSISIEYISGKREELVKNLNFISNKTYLKDENEKIETIILNPTKKEFKQLIKKKLFKETLTLKKVK